MELVSKALPDKQTGRHRTHRRSRLWALAVRQTVTVGSRLPNVRSQDERVHLRRRVAWRGVAWRGVAWRGVAWRARCRSHLL
eukprot:SAG22_NODE_9311_length_597_cov_0.694779_1_plen_81_part_10